MFIFVLERKQVTDERQAGEIKVRNLQVGGENAERKSPERHVLLYFFSVPPWRYFFLGEK